MTLFCGCNVFRMCLDHSAVSEEFVHNGVRWIRIDHQHEYTERCRAVAVMAQFRKVLAVIAWAAAHCPSCQVYWGPSDRMPQHDGFKARFGRLRDPLYEPERRCWYHWTWAYHVGAVWIQR